MVPGARFFRPRIVGDWLRVGSPLISSAVLSFPATLAVFPVTTSTSQLLTHHAPPNPAFYPLNTTILGDFAFSFTNSQDQPVDFLNNAPAFVLTFAFKTFLC